MAGSPGKPQPTYSEGEVRLLPSDHTDLIDITCLASRTSLNRLK